MESEWNSNSDFVNFQLTFQTGQVPDFFHFCPVSYNK